MNIETRISRIAKRILSSSTRDELAKLNAEFVGSDKVRLYRGGNVSESVLKNLRYNDYLSTVKRGKDAQGNGGASEYGRTVIELVLPIKDIKVTNGEIQYIGVSSSISKGKKYPPEIYRAYNDYYGSNYTFAEIDNETEKDVRNVASQALSGGRDEFDELMKKWK